MKDEELYNDPFVEVPDLTLQIKDVVGIKLESVIVTDRVSMNVKLPQDVDLQNQNQT